MADETHTEQPPRQYHERRPYHHPMRGRQHEPSHPAAELNKQEPTGEKPDVDEDEEERVESQHRSHGGHRGGRPPKKVYEEFINDPYCE